MENIEEKLNQILRELAYLREQIGLARDDSQKFAVKLDKEIKNRIDSAAGDVITQIRKISN
jgi:hypothetical protein